jgi:tetratricopeptide (TPR) repeat protein
LNRKPIGSKQRAILLALAFVLTAGLVTLAVRHHPVDHRAFERVASAESERARRELETSKPENAEESARRALAAVDKLLESRPNDQRYRRGRADALEIIALAQAAGGRPEEAADSLRQAVPFWADLVAERPGDIDDRRHLAACLDQLGLLLVDVGRWDEAESVFARGRTLCEKLPNAVKDEPQVRRDLVAFLSRLARLTLDMGRRSDSLDDFAQAVSVQRALVEAHPEQPESQGTLVGVLVDQAEAQAALNRPLDAERSLADASEVAQRLAAGDPAEARYQALAAKVLYQIATLIQADSHRASEARDALERAMTIQEKLGARPVDGRGYLVDLAATCGSLANLLCNQGLYGLAEGLYRKELNCQTTLVREHPADVSARFAHGRVLHNLADFLRERGRAKEALPLEREAAQELTSVYNKDFRNPEYRRALSYACWTLCALELDLKDHRAAAAALERYQRIEPSGFEEPLESARFVCRCIKLCRADSAVPEPQRESLARAYSDRAISALETAVRSGYNDLRDLQSAAAFEPLRGRDDFSQLVREVAARSQLAEHD